MINSKKVWFVTGASKGLGLVLVQHLLAQGYPVAATTRDIDALTTAVNSNDPNFLPLVVDLTNEISIADGIKAAHKKFGRMDVVVNNAGYGIGGAIEELTDAEVRRSFEVNVFAVISVIRQALPYMREQRAGHIINISSIAGFAASTGWGAYAATKAAVTGLSEVLAQDVAQLGIKVTVVAPGGFRTQFLSDDSLALSDNQIDAYAGIRTAHARFKTLDGQQAGDPELAADVFIQLAESANPLVTLFLGSDAYKRATDKVAAIQAGLEEWKGVSTSTDF